MNYLFNALTAHVNPANPFLMVPNGKAWSYGDMLKRSAQLANLLVASGVKKGDRVAVQVDKTPDMLFLYLACVQAGAAFLPLNTAYTLAEISYFLGDAKPALFVCDPQRLAEFQGANLPMPLETLGLNGGSLSQKADNQPTLFKAVACSKDDLAGILYTSGTTGRSKGAMMSHLNLASNAKALVKTWEYTSKDRLIHALPIFHTHGLFVATNVTLTAGASIIFLNKFEPESIINLMQNASVMMGVPTFYTRLLTSSNLTPESTQKMRLFISGSAPLLADTHRDWQLKTNHAILERYGMTETNMLTSNPYHGARRAGTVGYPLEGVSLRISNVETGAICATDDIGMIEVKGDNVFKEYWQMPEKTISEFTKDGYFITGDLGKIDTQGYVSIIGRGKDLVITGGFNVYPKEIETEIDGIEGVEESAVFGVPHADFGEGVTAAVVLNGKRAVSETEILAILTKNLAKFKQPKKVFILKELPRNTMGKVQKNLLRDKYKDIYK